MKKTSKALMIGASLLACAGAAQAASTYQINVTGASAQFNFWNDMAGTWLQTGPAGCTPAQITQALTVDNKRGYAKCTNSAGDTYILRYTSNASYDGITALQGTADPDSCNGGAGTILRKYADDTVAPDGTGHIPNANVVCRATVIGASDVNAASLSQSSQGAKLGPLGKPGVDDGAITTTDYMCGPTATVNSQGTKTKVFIDANASSPNALTNNVNHLAVPFSFFVNKGVTWKKCASGANAGGFCQDDADCGGTAGQHTICTSQTIDNLSRLQAVLLFSGTVTNWGQFGNYFDAKPVILCLRHAGSGTHATLDNAVMKGSWGKGLVTVAKNNYATNGSQQTYNVAGVTGGTSTALNYIWFNNGTSDLQNCLTGQIYDTVLGANQAARADLGIVGYMDSDQPDTATYVQVKYNGVKASRQALRNGWYDFYTMQNIYYNTGDATNFSPVNSLITNGSTGIIAFASNPNNLVNHTNPLTNVNESLFWATKGELRFTKSSDTVYPVTKSAVANTIPGAQTP